MSKLKYTTCTMIVCLALVILTACGPAATTAAPATSAPAATSAPEATATSTVVMPANAEVNFWVAATSDEEGVFKNQIEQFLKQNPDLRITLTSVPYVDFNVKLRTAIEAGTPPDMALLSYNHIVNPQMLDSLEPLDGKVTVDGFLKDALDSNMIKGQLYGLPLERSACEPHYRNLALFKAGKSQDAARKLIDFLAQPDQQKQNYKQLAIYPTWESLYKDLSLDCPESTAIRLQPEQVGKTIELVNSHAGNLTDVLEGQTLNAYEATALISPEGDIQSAAAPVAEPVSPADADARLKEGLIVGALFVNVPLELQDSPGNKQTVDPGDYAVKWRTDPEKGPKFYLVDPDKKEIEITVAIFGPTPVSVRQPFSGLLSVDVPLSMGGNSLTLSSAPPQRIIGPSRSANEVRLLSGSTQMCWWFWSLCGCIR